MEAADKSTERHKYRQKYRKAQVERGMLQGEEAAPLFPPDIPTMGNKFRACHFSLPGERLELPTGDSLTTPAVGSAGQRQIMYRASESPVSCTVSLPGQHCRGSAQGSHTPGIKLPASAGGALLSLTPSRHPWAAEAEPATAGLTTKSQTLQEMALKGGMRRDTGTKPRCATWRGAQPCF